MVQAQCIQKFRDKQGHIVGYQLQDASGKKLTVQPYRLKDAIRQKKINVVNLTLTSDNRLMDSSTKANNKVNSKRKSELSISDVAKAMIKVECSLLNMGDSYEELVENACYQAGMETNLWGMLKEELEEMHLKAYIKILSDKEKVADTYEQCTDYYNEGVDEICRSLVNHGGNPEKNSLLQSVNKIYEFGKILCNRSILNKEQFSAIDNIHSKVNSIDIPLCHLGYTIAYEFWQYLDEKYFFKSNDAFTVGYTTVDTDDEKQIGPYIMRGECSKRDGSLSKRVRYTIGVNRDGKGVKFDIFKWLHDGKVSTKPDFQFIQSLKPNTTDKTDISKMIANKLNELATQEMEN